MVLRTTAFALAFFYLVAIYSGLFRWGEVTYLERIKPEMCLQSRLLFALAVAVIPPSVAVATPLNISSFVSLGAFPSQSGTYSVTYDVNTNSVRLVGPSTSIVAVQYNSTAVFTFDAISIPASMTIISSPGQKSIAFLSKSNITVDGLINIGGSAGLQGPGGALKSGTAGPGGGDDRGRGGEGSGWGSSVGGGGGGGYGGTGGRGGEKPSAGGSHYYGGSGSNFGNLATTLLGGGNGGTGGHVLANIYYGAGGGGGGGAIELGAIGAVTIAGQGVLASGGNGGRGDQTVSQPAGGGGGGAGGGVLVHGDSVAFLSSIDVRGGAGGRSVDDSRAGGGGGGGGRVYVEYLSSLSGEGNVLLSGGTGSGDGLSGASGVLVAVPEPSTYALALVGLAFGGCSMWRRRKKKSQNALHD